MPSTDANGHTLADYRDVLADGRVLVGFVTRRAEYYHPHAHRVETWLLDDQRGFLAPMGMNPYTLAPEESIIDHVRVTQAQWGYEALSDYADGMLLADEVAEATDASLSEARVFSLHAVHGFETETVARMLDRDEARVETLLAATEGLADDPAVTRLREARRDSTVTEAADRTTESTETDAELAGNDAESSG